MTDLETYRVEAMLQLTRNFSLPSNTKDWLASIFLQLLFIVYTRNCQPCFYAPLCWMMGRRESLPEKRDSKSRENELDTSSFSKSISALLLSSCEVLHAALNYDTLALGENTKKHSCTTEYPRQLKNEIWSLYSLQPESSFTKYKHLLH